MAENKLQELKLKFLEAAPMLVVMGLPLVVVIEEKDKRLIYKVDDPDKYWSGLNMNTYFSMRPEEAKRRCTTYGTPISEEDLEKAEVVPAFQRLTSGWSYSEYRALFPDHN